MMLTADERELVLRVRAEVACIVHLVSLMEPPEAEQSAALAIDSFAEPCADWSPQFALVVSRHLSLEVRRLRMH